MFDILHEDDHQTVEKVGTNTLSLACIRCFFEQITLASTVQCLLNHSAPNVLLKAGFNNIRRIAIPGDLMMVGRGNMLRHGLSFLCVAD